MKKALLILALMLRVWWVDSDDNDQNLRSGVVLNWNVTNNDYMLVRNDQTTALCWVSPKEVRKSKWVEVRP